MKKLCIIIVSLLSAILLSTGCKEDKKGNKAAIPDISVASVEEDSIVLYKTYPGYLVASLRVDVVVEVSGRLLSINYTSGQYVKEGQVLYTIAPTTYKEAVERAEASLATARSQHTYAVQQYSALQKALKAEAVSKMEVLQAQSNVNQYAAAIQSAQSSLESAKLELSKCTVRAPISGYITSSAYDPGSYINGGGSPVVISTIFDDSRIGVKFNIEDSQYELMVSQGGISNKIYRKVPLEFAQKLPHTYTTDLYYDAPEVEKSTGSVVMKGTLSNEYRELKEGMYCTVRLPYGDNPEAILVKDASIGTDQLGKYVYLVNDSDKVEYRHIEVGDIYQDSLRLVTNGLKKGDRYVTSALLKVRNGMKINPKMVK